MANTKSLYKQQKSKYLHLKNEGGAASIETLPTTKRNEIGYVSSHGATIPCQFFFLPEGMRIYCIAPLSLECTLKDLKRYSYARDIEMALDLLPKEQIYNTQPGWANTPDWVVKRVAVPDVTLVFDEHQSSKPNKEFHQTYGIFPTIMDSLLYVPSNNQVLNTCFTSTSDCRDTIFEMIGCKRKKMGIEKKTTLSKVIRKIENYNSSEIGKLDPFPSVLVLFACRSCICSPFVSAGQAKFLDTQTNNWSKEDWEKVQSVGDEFGAFNYDKLVRILKLNNEPKFWTAWKKNAQRKEKQLHKEVY